MKKKQPPPNKRKPPERSLYERLRDHPLEPLRLNLSPQQLAQLRKLSPQEVAEVRKREAELEQARPKSLQEARRKIDRYILIRDNQIPPPWMKRETPKGGAKPGSAAAWFDALWPKGEWRLLTGGQCIEAIAKEAEKRSLIKRPSDRAIYAELSRRKKTP